MPYTPMQLAQVFIQTGELADALEALNQQLDAQPEDDSARRLRIGVCLRLNDDEHLRTALADFDQLAEITSDDQAARSVIFERLGDLDNAVQAMQQARELRTDSERWTERLLHLLISQTKINEAIELVRSQTRTWRWLQWEGDLLVMAGDDFMATARYGLALVQLDSRFDVTVDQYMAPIKARLLLVRAQAYQRLEQIEQAEEHYLEAEKFIPNEPGIPFNRGLLAALRGDLKEAVTLCSEGLSRASTLVREEMLQMLRTDSNYRQLAAEIDAKNNY